MSLEDTDPKTHIPRMPAPVDNAASSPPVLGENGRVVEGVVTTLDAEGHVHLAPMGPVVGPEMDVLLLRPFPSSTTYANLRRRGAGVFHVTDDVELVARAAVGQVAPLPRLATVSGVETPILGDACRWYAFRTGAWEESGPRASVVCPVTASGVLRDFLGFNRAKYAVVEAAILATRLHMLPRETVAAELARLAPLVDKTGAASERRAFEFLRRFIADYAGAPSAS